MNIQNSKNSVQNEQFSKEAENKEQSKSVKKSESQKDQPGIEKAVKKTRGKSMVSPEKGDENEFNPENTKNPSKGTVENKEESQEVDEDIKDIEVPVPPEKTAENKEESQEVDEDIKDIEVLVPHSKKTVENKEESQEVDEDIKDIEVPLPQSKETINYNLLSKQDLVKVLSDLIDRKSVTRIRDDVEAIKIAFYKKYQEDIDRLKIEFAADGSDPEEFEPPEDPAEVELKELLKKFKDARSDFEKLMEDEKDVNLRKKFELIDEIKDLVNRDESINKTFQEFRDLQKQWYEIGIVPQKELKNLWENYHYHVEKFYDYIKINKELRDLDLKKNLESKLELCEKAEALVLEPNVVNAFQTLQKYHDQWREIGPVPKEKRSEIWERFREATAKVNKKHQQYYQDLKDTQRKNLESKTLLCNKAEEISTQDFADHDQWMKKTRELLELQKVWKTIGFAPKKDNNRIYARFRSACDLFFEKKREYYAQNMEDQQKNMQQKLDLCIQAESLQDSQDWKNTTDELIRLQKKWKTIGAVPRKHSDELWKRFRAACDRFFNRKSEFFSKIDTTYEKNLADKENLIKEVNEFEPGENLKLNLKKLNEFQRRWSEIGFVPLDKKDEIMQVFRDAINKHYDSLEMDDYKKNMLKFRNKVDNIKQKPRSDIKLRFEREKLMNKLQQLKSDIGVWENNIGFFANSENADSMVKDFEKKIESAREKIKLLEDKIIFIDELENDEE